MGFWVDYETRYEIFKKTHKFRCLVSIELTRLNSWCIYTLDNRRPVLPFDYTGQGLVGNDYGEGGYAHKNYTKEDYDKNNYGFASWRLGCSSFYCKCF